MKSVRGPIEVFLCPEELNEASTDGSTETEPSSDADLPPRAFDEVDGSAPAPSALSSVSYPQVQPDIKREPVEFSVEKCTVSQTHSSQQQSSRHKSMLPHQAQSAPSAGQQLSGQTVNGQQAPPRLAVIPEDSASSECCTGEECLA